MTFPAIDINSSGFTGNHDLLGAPNNGCPTVSISQNFLHLSVADEHVGSSQLRLPGLPGFDWKGEN